MSVKKLPTMSSLNKSNDGLLDGATRDEKIKLVHQLFNEEESKNRNIDRSGITPITYDMLQAAPADYFASFNKVVKQATKMVQESISASNKASIIAKLNSNPTDKTFRQDALFTISNELGKAQAKIQELRMLSTTERNIVFTLVFNEIAGLGPLEPLWNNPKVTEIMANGPFDIQVEIGGKLTRVPAAQFRDKQHLQELISRLFGSINKSVSRTNPAERGRLHDNSRMYAVHEMVAPDGPNFNIRRHQEQYWTVSDLIRQGTADKELMTFLGNLIYSGASFLVIGGTGTGKTTLMNALTGFFSDEVRILTLEENLEMKPHPDKMFAAAMECIPAKAGSTTGVNMRDLVRSSLQMRPDVILIGEVSDGAAYDLCQANNTGHTGGSSLHANSPEDAMYRMMSLVSQEELVKGPAAYDLIASAFDIVIMVERFRNDGSRKIVEVREVDTRPSLNESNQTVLKTKPLWEFNADEYDFDKAGSRVAGKWKQVRELSKERQAKIGLDLAKHLTWEELEELSSVKGDK